MIDAKEDSRPHRGGWAPGSYICKCSDCCELFMGEKRSWQCADCAYLTLSRNAEAEGSAISVPVWHHALKVFTAPNTEIMRITGDRKHLIADWDAVEKTAKEVQGLPLEQSLEFWQVCILLTYLAREEGRNLGKLEAI